MPKTTEPIHYLISWFHSRHCQPASVSGQLRTCLYYLHMLIYENCPCQCNDGVWLTCFQGFAHCSRLSLAIAPNTLVSWGRRCLLMHPDLSNGNLGLGTTLPLILPALCCPFMLTLFVQPLGVTGDKAKLIVLVDGNCAAKTKAPCGCVCSPTAHRCRGGSATGQLIVLLQNSWVGSLALSLFIAYCDFEVYTVYTFCPVMYTWCWWGEDLCYPPWSVTLTMNNIIMMYTMTFEDL